jgi:NADH-quinone oxidoreductase subunit J
MVAFFIVAAILVSSALCVVLLSNPIHCSLALIVNLITVAAIYALLNAHFLAAAQVVVYAGAIVVLLLFVLMLLNAKEENPGSLLIKPTIYQFLGTLLVIGFLGIVTPVFFSLSAIPENLRLFIRSGGIEGDVAAVGKILYTKYVFQFEIASVLILSAVAGAVYLAKRKPQKNKL